jgi:hypothetical protein
MGVRKASYSILQRHRPLLAPHPVGLGLVDVEYPEERDRDLAFIKDEGNVLAEATAPWFATFFIAAASIKLFSTNLGILDWVSQLTADSLKVSFLGGSQFWSESKIYLTVVWSMITIGTVIILTGMDPVVLLIITAPGPSAQSPRTSVYGRRDRGIREHPGRADIT